MNRLASQSSLYLRQHVENPVDWQPWGPEAFLEATERDVPILLSIGYASCHWCHVMAHESFEDEATARQMNESFVCIKIDREERPDIDAVYMEATQAMTAQGGWPMTVFTTPDGRPFFAGTYFPSEEYGGIPAFTDVLQAVTDAWLQKRQRIETQADELHKAIAARTSTQSSEADPVILGETWLHQAHQSLADSVDHEWGGFGKAPKFPQWSALELMMVNEDPDELQVVTTTLDAMASGGIYDHVGGGFHRYSVDAFWMVPHFEKMLYDQASAIRTYLHAWKITGKAWYRQVVEETVGYVNRELKNASADAFFSSQDADTEGEEGSYYTWRREDIALAVKNNARVAIDWYGVTNAGNFEGANILHRPKRGDLLRPPDVEMARVSLLQAREARNTPATDDKILTEWNAMYIAALAEAGTALNRPEWVDDACAAADFLQTNLCNAQGRWMRVWHPASGAMHLAYASDYAWLSTAFFALSEATGEARWRAEALRVTDTMLQIFWDETEEGLFTTGNDAEELIVRAKDLLDGATASANSVSALVLIRAGAITGNAEYTNKAISIVKLAASALAHYPTACMHLLLAVDLLVGQTSEIVVAGDYDELVAWVHSKYLPRNVLLWGERDESPLWTQREDGGYLCQGRTCSPPVCTVKDLSALLRR